MSLLNRHKNLSRKSSTTANQTTFYMNPDETREIFKKFDKNKDGKISKDEYNKALDILNGRITKNALTHKAFEAVDTDGDGYIDLEEFTNAQDGVKKSEIEGAFHVFDVDGNGKISAEELMAVLKRLGERCSLSSCKKMIKGVDRDGDGLIDMDEFMGMMMHTMKIA